MRVLPVAWRRPHLLLDPDLRVCRRQPPHHAHWSLCSWPRSRLLHYWCLGRPSWVSVAHIKGNSSHLPSQPVFPRVCIYPPQCSSCVSYPTTSMWSQWDSSLVTSCRPLVHPFVPPRYFREVPSHANFPMIVSYSLLLMCIHLLWVLSSLYCWSQGL